MGIAVSKSTLLLHVADPWKCRDLASPSHFCENSECEAVYFTESGENLLKTKPYYSYYTAVLRDV